MTDRHADRIYTGKGFYNDIEANLLKICKIAFEQNEDLRYDLSWHPKQWLDCNPNKVSTVSDLPALYVWADGFQPSTDSIGKSLGKKMTQKLKFYCNVQYIIPLIEDYEGDKKMKELAWFLFEAVSENQNLYDIANGDAEIYEVTTYPALKVVGDKLTPVSSVNIKIVFNVTRKTVMAKR